MFLDLTRLGHHVNERERRKLKKGAAFLYNATILRWQFCTEYMEGPVCAQPASMLDSRRSHAYYSEVPGPLL